MPSSSLRAPRFLVAVAVSALVILWAPFVGQIRSTIKTAFPGQFVRIVGGAVAIAVAIAVVFALARIRQRRGLRYTAIAAALLSAGWYTWALGTGNPEVDAVERFHFIEYGIVTFLFFRAWRPLDDGSVYVLAVLSAMLIGTLEEWFQWFIPVRIGEMRDVFLNCAAIACGLLFSIGVDPPAAFRFSLERGSRARIGVAAAVVTIVFALFFHVVHLGYTISDSETGAFRSRYSRENLIRIAADRSARWRSDPPLVLHRLSREDQYLSEGVWHVQRRNKAWDAGDVFAAWQENRILEVYYAPVLDTPSFVSRTGHRWPAAQREDAQIRLESANPPARVSYVSDAQQYPIYAWPKRMYWTAVAAIALLIAVPPLWIDRRHPSAGARAGLESAR